MVTQSFQCFCKAQPRIFGERAKSGRGLKGEGTFCPRAASVARRPARLSAEPSRKIAITFFDFARPQFLLKLKGGGNFSARQCRLAARRRAERLDIFRDFR